MTNVLTKAASLVCVLLCHCQVFGGTEKLLSRNATYRLSCHGLMYVEQIMPGTSERAKVTSWVYSPLVEETDQGDLLIDGITAGPTMVYTPWYWSAQAKNIVVEMTLPGRSKVSRVRVTFPQTPGLRPHSSALAVRGDNGQWRRIASKYTTDGSYGDPDLAPSDKRATSLTFRQKKPLDCRELKISTYSNRPRVGVMEIEVWGEGPTAGKTRGLVRRKPHIQTIKPRKPNLPQGSVLLTRQGRTTVKLSGWALTSGKASMLVDGNRASVARIDSPKYKHPHLTAELDLGRAYLIDAVNVVMPGDQSHQ